MIVRNLVRLVSVVYTKLAAFASEEGKEFMEALRQLRGQSKPAETTVAPPPEPKVPLCEVAPEVPAVVQVVVVSHEVTVSSEPVVVEDQPLMPAVVETPPAAEPVIATTPIEAPPIPVAAPTKPVVPVPTLEEIVDQVTRLFQDYINALGEGDFQLANEIRNELLKRREGVYSYVWVLHNKVLFTDPSSISSSEGYKYVPEGVEFKWKENGEMCSSSNWDDVPMNKMTTTLLYALRDATNNRRDAEEAAGEPKRIDVSQADAEVAEARRQKVPYGGFRNHKVTGKTARKREERGSVDSCERDRDDNRSKRTGPKKGKSQGKGNKHRS